MPEKIPEIYACKNAVGAFHSGYITHPPMNDANEIHAHAALLAYAASEGMLRSTIAILKLRKRIGTLADLDLIIAYTALAEPATRNDHDGLASVARAAKENFERRCLWPAFQPKTAVWLS